MRLVDSRKDGTELGGAGNPGGVAEARMLLNAREAAHALHVCERTLWAITKNEGLRCVKIRGRVLYDPDDLKRWIESHKAGQPVAPNESEKKTPERA